MVFRSERFAFKHPEGEPSQPESFGEDFEQWAVSSQELDQTYPLGPETDPPEVREQREQAAQGVLQKILQHPFTKPVFKFLSMFVGAGAVTMAVLRESAGALGKEIPEIAEELEDPGVRYELRRIVYDELLDRGEVGDEQEAREGKESWVQEERLEYEQIRDLSGKFEYLHKDQPELVASYRDPQMRIESYRGIVDLMRQEFRHSLLPFEFAQSCIESSVEVLGQMEPEAAKGLYVQFSEDLMRTMGVRAVRQLAQNLTEGLPADHPVVQKIQQDGWLTQEVGEWLKPSKQNTAIFDQGDGEIRIFHHAGGKGILLDVFPGNGGSPDGVAWERGMPAHVAVRTPDGNFTFDRSFEKKSYSWRNSWVVDTASLRWAQDGENVEYQDVDGKWRRLTGEEGEFTVWGTPEKPFEEKTKSRIYQWSSEKLEDGSWRRPNPFTVKEALGPDGKLREIWDRNDFGPKSIEIKDDKGMRMTIFFHSSPADEASNVFLDYSHGCIHMKPQDLEAMAGYLERGSGIRISSFEEILSRAQFEKPEGGDEPTG